MAEAKKNAVFTKVDQLRPGTSGHNLIIKVVDCKPIVQKGRNVGQRMSECLVGDETGMIVFTSRNDQVELIKAGDTVTLRNARIDMYKGSMRLALDKWGRIEVEGESADFTVKEDNNLSLIEFEVATIVDG